MSTIHHTTLRRSAVRRVVAVVATGILAAAGLVFSGAPAQSSTNLVIDSPAGCRALFDMIGASLGSVSRRTCYVSSEGAEVQVPAGSTVTIASGWEVMVDSVVFRNYGTIRNEGYFRANGDVVNNVGSAVFDNTGHVIVDLSGMYFFDRAVFLNRRSGRVNLNLGGMQIDGWAGNWGVIDVATSLDVRGTLVNKGAIRVAHDGGVLGIVTGRQPVVMPYDASPTLASSYPVDGAAGVRRDAKIVLRFSEPVTAIRNWYRVWFFVPGAMSATMVPARAYRLGVRTYAIDPVGPLPAATEITVRLSPGLVLDNDAIDPPGAMREFFPGVQFTTR